MCVEFGASVFLSGKETGGVIKSVSLLAGLCGSLFLCTPKKLPWQLSNLSKSSVANQLTRQVTLKYLFLTRKWVQDAPSPTPPPARACVCSCVAH